MLKADSIVKLLMNLKIYFYSLILKQVGSQLLEQTPLDIPIIVYGGNKEINVDEPFLNRFQFFKLIKKNNF